MENTKESILNAAERLFAERGFEATSLRAITTAAGVNLAAVNYHFQSKEGLLQALFVHRMEMLNRKRLEMLDSYEAEFGKKPIPLEKLVRALIEPMFAFTGEHSGGGRTFGMLMGRMYSSPQSCLSDLLLADIQNFADRFGIAIRRTLPGIPSEDLYWRSFFALGATAHTLVSAHLLEKISRGICSLDDRETALEGLVAFITAGWKAPVRAKKRKISPLQISRTNKGM